MFDTPVISGRSVEFWMSGRTATHLKCRSTATQQRPVLVLSLSRTQKKLVSFWLPIITILVAALKHCLLLLLCHLLVK